MRLAARPPLARIMAIDLAVRSGSCPNATELARRLEVRPRTIRRDLAYMRDQLGAPIAFNQIEKRYFYTESTFRLPYFQLSEGEFLALMLAQQVLKQYRGTPFAHELERVFAKLQQALPEHVGLRLDAAADCLAVLPPVRTEYNPESFALLARAVVEKRTLEVVYHTPDRQADTRRVWKPYHLLLRGDDWYVIAHDSHRSEIRVFAVQRVRSGRLLDEHFDHPPGFRVEHFLADAFRVIRGDGHHEIALRFKEPTATRIAEKSWHPDQTLQRTRKGLVLRFTVSDLREVKRWVLYWGADCEVLGPEELREEVRNELISILERAP
jgi:proteasome accessory factor B